MSIFRKCSVTPDEDAFEDLHGRRPRSVRHLPGRASGCWRVTLNQNLVSAGSQTCRLRAPALSRSPGEWTPSHPRSARLPRLQHQPWTAQVSSEPRKHTVGDQRSVARQAEMMALSSSPDFSSIATPQACGNRHKPGQPECRLLHRCPARSLSRWSALPAALPSPHARPTGTCCILGRLAPAALCSLDLALGDSDQPPNSRHSAHHSSASETNQPWP